MNEGRYLTNDEVIRPGDEWKDKYSGRLQPLQDNYHGTTISAIIAKLGPYALSGYGVWRAGPVRLPLNPIYSKPLPLP